MLCDDDGNRHCDDIPAPRRGNPDRILEKVLAAYPDGTFRPGATLEEVVERLIRDRRELLSVRAEILNRIDYFNSDKESIWALYRGIRDKLRNVVDSVAPLD